jgi:pimeloyl-ACP methyl ester carboxylesterase
MSAILLENAIVHYEVLGRGRPTLFLHGWLGSWRYWIPVMQLASSNFRAYALDLWGFGDTAKETRRYSLEGQLQLLDSFLEELGIARLALVGHGLGAILALMCARRHPEVVDRVLAVACPLDEAMLSLRLNTAPLATLADWLLERDSQADAVRAELSKTDTQAVHASFASLATLNLAGLWKDNKTATLLVNGLNDPAVTAARPEVLSELPYMIHMVTFDQSGHFPMLSETSKFSRLLVDFLALTSGDSPRELQLKEEWKRRVR